MDPIVFSSRQRSTWPSGGRMLLIVLETCLTPGTVRVVEKASARTSRLSRPSDLRVWLTSAG